MPMQFVVCNMNFSMLTSNIWLRLLGRLPTAHINIHTLKTKPLYSTDTYHSLANLEKLNDLSKKASENELKIVLNP